MENRIFGLETEFGCMAPEHEGFVSPDAISVKVKDHIFHSERIAKVMDRMGHKDGEVIQHSMVTKSLERAQQKVEENNFGIRKRLLEYDDVMNSQREAIYKKRNNALSGNRIAVDLNNMLLSFIL